MLRDELRRCQQRLEERGRQGYSVRSNCAGTTVSIRPVFTS
jgi:hypothetical protein